MRAPAPTALLALVLSTLPLAAAEPTPGVSLSERIVPEPYETNDFISYAEARAMLDAIAEASPDFVEVVEVAESVGWDRLGGGHDTWPVLVVEVTNEASAVPRAQKDVVLFQLSIHGNEKGGREGGLRVIEDLAMLRLYGGDYRDLLDRVLVVFTLPNPDGWTHEEVPYRHNCPDYFGVGTPAGCVETQGFVRVNGHGQDLNRDWPTKGWYQTDFGRENAFSEPEMRGLGQYLTQFRGRTLAAADIHGMLTPADGGVNAADAPFPLNFVVGNEANGEPSYCAPENPAGVECAREGHFVLGLPVGDASDALLTLRTVRLYERSKEYLNAMAEEEFPYWTSSPNAGTAGGEWTEWGTGWDTIGYTDSGSTGRWFPEGLGAPGGTFEMSYNHVTFDNHYVPEVNKMHVESVRGIVRAFLDEAREPRRPALDFEGTVAWLGGVEPRRSADAPPQDGPHAGSADDDAYERPYEASTDQFWRDLARHAAPGDLVEVRAPQVEQGRFHDHRTLVVAGEAWDLVKGSPEALRHLRMHLDQGGRLFLSDAALQALEALDLAEPGSVEEGKAYLGYVDLDRGHALAAEVRGLARQTYDGVSVGYPIPAGTDDGLHAPVWTVRADALRGGEVAGTSLGPDRASLGRVPAGAGEVVFLGALLPPPSDASYHPYGLAAYGVTYTGYQLVYNALGTTLEERAAGDPAPREAPAPPRPAPGPEAVLLAGVLGFAALARAWASTRR